MGEVTAVATGETRPSPRGHGARVSVKGYKLHWVNNSASGFDDDPVLKVEAVGIHDVYRLAHHLEHGQCEFAAIGRKAKRGLRRKLRQDRWGWLLRHMHGDGGYNASKNPSPSNLLDTGTRGERTDA